MDPTTAVQCIDRLHDGLRQLATRRIFDGRVYDDNGTLRVVIPSMDWDGYVHLAFDEIRLAGAGSPQVSRRLTDALQDLLTVAPPQRHAALAEQLELLHKAARDSARDRRDIHFALQPDRQGIGAAADGDRVEQSSGPPRN